MQNRSVYELAGGEPAFKVLVERGHPRLRLRHQPFAIGRPERDAWLGHMTAAVESMDLPPAVRKAFRDYFETASTAMINRPAPQ